MTGITLPTDTQKSRLAPRTTVPQEDVLDTLREYERLARVACPSYTIASRFTPDGESWVNIWLHTEPPAGVKTVVVRDGVATEEARSWHEAVPAEGEQRAEWLANPATRLRAFVERAALRRAFADVIVGREQPAAPSVAALAARGTSTATATAVVGKAPAASTLAHPWDAAPQPANGDDVWAPTPARSDELRRPRPLDHLPSNRASRRAQKRKGHRRGR